MRSGSVIVVIITTLLAAAPAQAAHWLPSDGQSCATVCTRAGMAPVVSGRYRNGNVFSICRADVGGEGARPGYNLQPDWAHACFVAHGGRERGMPHYECFCDR
jgi:hypothetical protein